MDVNFNNTLLKSRSNTQGQDASVAENERLATQLESQAMDDALWRMAANNAMAKIKGFNSLAKAANDLA